MRVIQAGAKSPLPYHTLYDTYLRHGPHGAGLLSLLTAAPRTPPVRAVIRLHCLSPTLCTGGSLTQRKQLRGLWSFWYFATLGWTGELEVSFAAAFVATIAWRLLVAMVVPGFHGGFALSSTVSIHRFPASACQLPEIPKAEVTAAKYATRCFPTLRVSSQL